MPLLYQIQDLQKAIEFLQEHKNQEIILTNPKGSTRYYGMLVLDYMFKTLQQNFPQITKIIVEVDDDVAALFTAAKLGYKHIIYKGTDIFDESGK